MRKLRLLAALFVLPWLMMAAFHAHFAAASPLSQAGPQTFTVMVGNAITTKQGDKPSWQGQNFYPGTITVNAGDSITWKFDSGLEPHTVTFLGPEPKLLDVIVPDLSAGPPAAGAPPKLIINPQIQLPTSNPAYDGSAFANSGFVAADIPGPKEFTLTFPKAGSFPYVCQLHAFAMPDGTMMGMKGTVVVQPTGSAYPMTPEQVTAEGLKERAADAQRAATLEQQIESAPVKSEPMADGSTKYRVDVGNMDMERNLEYQRFTPKTLNIKVGDTVEWSLPMPGLHNVLFGAEIDLTQIEPQQSGPPKLVINPQFVIPSGGPVHTGTGVYNSSRLGGPGDPPEVGPQSYSLKFTQAGRYEYNCTVHYNLGMDGTIIVSAASGEGSGGVAAGGGSVGMPRTGSAGGDDWLLAFGALGAVLALSGVALRVRKARHNA